MLRLPVLNIHTSFHSYTNSLTRDMFTLLATSLKAYVCMYIWNINYSITYIKFTRFVRFWDKWCSLRLSCNFNVPRLIWTKLQHDLGKIISASGKLSCNINTKKKRRNASPASEAWYPVSLTAVWPRYSSYMSVESKVDPQVPVATAGDLTPSGWSRASNWPGDKA